MSLVEVGSRSLSPALISLVNTEGKVVKVVFSRISNIDKTGNSFRSVSNRNTTYNLISSLTAVMPVFGKTLYF